jgi:hypothetical protein
MNEPARTIVAVILAGTCASVAVAWGFSLGAAWAIRIMREAISEVFDLEDEDLAAIRATIKRVVADDVWSRFPVWIQLHRQYRGDEDDELTSPR